MCFVLLVIFFKLEEIHVNGVTWLKVKSKSRAVVAYAFNPNTPEAEAGVFR